MLDVAYKAKVIDAAKRQIPADVLAATSDECTLANLAHRPTMELIKGMVALSAVSSDTVMANGGQLLDRLSALVAHLSDLQLDEGLFCGGDNLVSPPDSGFTINDLCLAMELVGLDRCSPEVMAVVKEPLMAIARKAAPAMLVGGIHTPNHRWEISSALVGLGVLLDDKRLIERAHPQLRRACLQPMPDRHGATAALRGFPRHRQQEPEGERPAHAAGRHFGNHAVASSGSV